VFYRRFLGELASPSTPDGIEQREQAIWNGNGIPDDPAATGIVHTILAECSEYKRGFVPFGCGLETPIGNLPSTFARRSHDSPLPRGKTRTEAPGSAEGSLSRNEES